MAASMCGITPVAAAEVEPYPIAVTRSRFPNMKHLGDISKVNGAEIEPVDIVSFGAPCQDLSVAGLRKGLRHDSLGDEETTRSGLFMEAVRIIKEMREATNGEYPRYAVYENVPGAFSSSKGSDFRIVLEELIKIVEPTATMPPVPKAGWPYADYYCGDGWSIAYRVLDAQYWGVPQRRRRIYLVADFRAERAREVLFEREGLRGYFAQGGTPWKAVARDAESGAGADDREGEGIGEVIPINTMVATRYKCDDGRTTFGVGEVGDPQFTISAGHEHAVAYCEGYDGYNGDLTGDKTSTLGRNGVIQTLCMATQQGGAEIMEDRCPTITAAAGMSGNNQPVVCYDARGNGNGKICNTITGDHENRVTDYTSVVVEPTFSLQGNTIDRDAKQNGAGVCEPISHTLNAVDRHGVVYAVDQGGGKSGANVTENTAPTLCTTHGGEPAVAYGINGDVAGTLDVSYYKGCGMRQGVEREVVVLSIGNGQLNQISMSETCNTPDCMHDKQAVLVKDEPIAIDRAFFNQGQNALYDPQPYEDGTNPTLVARGPNTVAVRYIVRRLTPTECARLQGFPDKWGHPDIKAEQTDEEYAFWLEVRNTHAAINGKAVKEYTKEQMLTWYNKLHTDSSEYKMWGNGIALPTALYVMQGIKEALLNGQDHPEPDR